MFKNPIDFTVNQKVSLLSYLRIFTRKNSICSVEELFNKFVEEQQYLLEIKQPKFEWIYDYIEEPCFSRYIKKVIKDNLLKIEYKEKNKEYIERNKKFLKEAALRARNWRQSKEKPTKKQVLYYKSLCSKFKIKEEEIYNKSKMDLKNMISEILEKGSKNGI